ncbi:MULTISPECIES: NHL domain-containing protein [Streptomyces]|nr:MULTISPECIES: RICIN domain-containing protein [Streptomyces]MBC2875600.1 RICIN domain-containing protein [Streptomyces sp. TYQ1024]UBI35830.1 RICIN domain-containing protein [Streptomyces mobaraensis]UKW28424.1 RICIN domain-containing protein [Streptomyces sp. TYQ1024]
MSTASTGAGNGEHSARLITTVAGTGTAGGPKGDKEPAVSALLHGPYGVAVDRDGTLYVAEYGGHRIRKVTTDGKISTVAGTGSPGRGAEGVSAVSAPLHTPRGIAVDSAGDLYIAESGNSRIRKVTMADGKIRTFAGTGTATYGGEGVLATAAHLNAPFGVAVDGADNVYIADYGNHRIRKVTADGKINTVVGTVAGLSPDGTLATAAQLKNPSAVAVDSAGNLYIAELGNQRVRKVTKADGKIKTVAGTGAGTFGGDGVQAASAPLFSPMAVVVDSTDTLYIADTNNHRVRKVAADGTISTVAGTGAPTFGGDGEPAASAKLSSPHGLAVDCVDTLYIADYANNRVRKVTSAKLAGLPDSGTVVSWANVRSRLRMSVVRESTSDGAEVHQTLTVPRGHQRWRLIAAGQDDGEVLYRIENVRSGKVLEVVGAQETKGAVVAQRSYEGADAHHQHWRLIPVGPATGTPRVYEIANRNSGLLLGVDTNARTVIKQYEAAGAPQDRQWQLLPV